MIDALSIERMCDLAGPGPGNGCGRAVLIACLEMSNVPS